MLRAFPAVLTTAAVLWSAILLVAPYALTSGNARLVSAAATVYSAAGLICHQRSARSFHLVGVQLPVCARCSGLYMSGAFGAVLAWVALRPPRAPLRSRNVLLLASVPTALSVILEWIGGIDPTNRGRFLCALPIGGAAAWIFVQSLRAEANRMPERRPPTSDRSALANREVRKRI